MRETGQVQAPRVPVLAAAGKTARGDTDDVSDDDDAVAEDDDEGPERAQPLCIDVPVFYEGCGGCLLYTSPSPRD